MKKKERKRSISIKNSFIKKKIFQLIAYIHKMYNILILINLDRDTNLDVIKNSQNNYYFIYNLIILNFIIIF